jgi:hypothetical protein
MFLKYWPWNSRKDMSDRISTMIPHKLQKFDMTTEATSVDFAFFTPAVKRMLPRADVINADLLAFINS